MGHNHVAELVFAYISAVGEHTLNGVEIYLPAARGTYLLCVEVVHNLLNRLAVGVHSEDFLDDGCVHLVALIAAFFVDLVAESNLPAVAYAFERVLLHTAHNLFGKLGRVVFRHTFEHRFK